MSVADENLPTAEEFRLDLSVYSADAAKRAAYTLLGRATVQLRADGDELVCTVSSTGESKSEPLSHLVQAFRDELLDQDLRERISQESAPVRNAILAHAFSRTGLQG